MKRIFWAILFFTTLHYGGQAQDVKVSATVDSLRYQIGDWITLHLTVDAPSTYTVRLPATDDDFEGGDFISAGKAEMETHGKRKEYRQDVVTTIFDTGSIALRVRVQYTMPGDTASFISFSPRINFEISTVALDTAQSFKDIKEVMHVPLTLWDYLLYAAVVLMLVLVGWFGYRWYQKRKNRPEEILEEAEPEIPAYVVALDALQTLRERKLWQSGQHKAYQSQVTDILRAYIERRFRLPAMEQTTSEIIPRLAMLGLSPHLVEQVEQVLHTADFTKFAKYIPSSMQHEDSMTVSVQFVESTKPIADAANAPAAGPATLQAASTHVATVDETGSDLTDAHGSEGGTRDV
ncbi:MAG: hypothetical protein IH600_13330 [Bacteroidetes bacterium]|nr:hypothetical protein [Bacteroidota bacterium]